MKSIQKFYKITDLERNTKNKMFIFSYQLLVLKFIIMGMCHKKIVEFIPIFKTVLHVRKSPLLQSKVMNINYIYISCQNFWQLHVYGSGGMSHLHVFFAMLHENKNVGYIVAGML